MSELNEMLDNTKSVTLEMFLSYNLDTQMRGIDLMMENENYVTDVFQEWGYEYFKAIKYNDVDSIRGLEDHFDLSVMETFVKHKSIFDNA
tara:strand:+ start:380 stop:649 length:270 start_codon:yes stop_codon:yes gene_type:complete